MAQPSAYNRSFSFANFQAGNPSDPLPGDELDGELNNVKTTLDGVLTNLALIQNDDGTLKNEVVGLDQIADEVSIGFNVPTAWATGVAYLSSPASTVFNGGKFYRCLVAHTSGVFATDLAAAKWQLIADFTAIPVGTAAQISFTPVGTVSSSTVQAAIEEVASEKAALSHTHPATDISDSTTIGRSLLTAASAAAIRTAIDAAQSTAVQPIDATLTALAGLATASNKLPYFTASDTATLTDLTAFGRSLIDDADAAAARTTLGLGTSATVNTGTSGATIPLLNGANTWADVQTFSKPPKYGYYSATGLGSSSTTVADIPGLLAPVENGKKYIFRAVLFFSASGSGGAAAGMFGTATFSSIRYQVWVYSEVDSLLTGSAQKNALGQTSGRSGAATGMLVIEGAGVCNGAGNLTAVGAQNTGPNGTTTFQALSSLEVIEVS